MAIANHTALALPKRFANFTTDHDRTFYPTPAREGAGPVLVIDTHATPVLLAATLQARIEQLRALLMVLGYASEEVTPAEVTARLQPAVQETAQLAEALVGRLRAVQNVLDTAAQVAGSGREMRHG